MRVCAILEYPNGKSPTTVRVPKVSADRFDTQFAERDQVRGPRHTLFLKYFLSLFAAVVVPLVAAGVSEAWFGYRDQRARLNDLSSAESRLASSRIENFIESIRDQLEWAVQVEWDESEDDQHRLDALRLLRQVPAIASITLVDGRGRERAFVSRLGLDRTDARTDLSLDPAVVGARSAKVWYGPVSFERGSEPYMTVSVAGSRAAAGVAIARTNLKLIWDVVSEIKIGDTGSAFVLDGRGRLIAHPDLSLVLRGDAQDASFVGLKADMSRAGSQAITATDIHGDGVLALMAPIRGPDWSVVVEQPLREAFAPIRAALWRTGGLIIAGTLLALALAYGLARRMTKPIRVLENGVERIGAGQFDHRIVITSGDEFEQLAKRFNEMARELQISKEKSERINRLKRFLAPQVAELVENSGDDRLLEGQRREVVAIFADLRNFTAFSARASPETVMALLGEFYQALGTVITRHGATLTNLAGDGAMVLVNAPVPCPAPAQEALRIATEMQAAVQPLIVAWQNRGYAVGFGIGLAMGPATVGRVGYEGRLDYTAIGNVVNLASRLCAEATNGQILVDSRAAETADESIPLLARRPLRIKGFEDEVPVFVVSSNAPMA